jgi:nucleotide-binding universal stress UspA family protein
MVFMFERVLFATDFSEYSYKTLECILGIPGIQEVVLLHVVDATHPSKKGWIHDPEIKNAEMDLEGQKSHLIAAGIKGTVRLEVITSGTIADTVVSIAPQEGVSLIITGALGKGTIQSVLLGSVSKEIIRKAVTHVLIMRYRTVDSIKGPKFEQFCPGIFSKVLYPTDFSKPASEIVPLLKKMDHLGEVTLLHVITKGETKQEIDAYVEDAKNRLQIIAGDLQGAGIQTTTAVRLGSPSDEINLLAEEEDSSLIIMGRHGYGWVREMFLGSTVDMVVKRTKRPILVIQPEFRKE